jgi:polysaccharide biosynthesis protein PslG
VGVRSVLAAFGLAVALASTACESVVPAVSPPPEPGPVATAAPQPAPVMLTDGQIGVADRATAVSLWDRPDQDSASDLDAARADGATWVKQQFEWRAIEPAAKGQFQWAEADRVVDAVTASGLKLIVSVDNQPSWAAARVTFPANGPADNPRDFADFVQALAMRYQGRIQAYEIWDQPNLASRWGNRRPDPGEYTRLLRAAYPAIKQSDPQALVVSAALAPTTRYDETSVPDLLYLRSMYGANAKGSFDVLGVNATGFTAPACMDPQQVAENPALTNDDQTLPVEGRRVYAFRHVEDVRGIMSDRGDGNKPIGILQLSPAAQADAFACARENWSPWIGFVTVAP